MKNKNLVLCRKWQLLGRDLAGRVLFLWLSPSALENHIIAKSSSEAPPGQAVVLCRGWPPLEVWLPHRARGRCAFCYCFSFCSPPASQEPLTAAWGDFKHCWANLLFFWMVGLFNVFEGGGPGFFVLGVYTSSWPGGIFRARGCEGASSVNPSHFILLEMVPVGGFPTFWPFENLYLLGTVVTLLSQVWLGLTGHRPIISGLLAIVTCHNKFSSFWPPWGTAEAAAFIHSGQKEQGWTVTQGEIV